jgi:hypothetical protein
LAEMDKRIKGMKVMGGDGGVSQDVIDSLMGEIRKLRDEFEAHRDISNNNLNNLNNEMPNKADKKDLIDLENRIMD